LRSKFDQQLALLNKEMIEMGALCEEIISDVLRALLQKDSTFLNEIPSLGAEIDRKERAIETLCLKLLLQQQPVAKDLRQISAALKMITDMERIGDQAEDIAGITPFVTNRSPKIDTLLHKMAESSIKMVTESVDAFVEQNIDLAKKVLIDDDIVDNYFTLIKRELIHEIIERTNDGECYIDLLMISKYFERIADHATNIAEWVVFSVTGIHKEG
jgi:phosphate transport system protein